MRRNERGRHAAIALLLALGSCSPPRPAEPTQSAEAPAAPGPGLCHVGPDGGPLLSDRGIGGTGAPPAPTLTAERGIGGTGAPTREADRGIGGTGIIGVVTGFASVCLAGQEVALPPSVPVDIDGEPAGLDQLRAGQVAVLDASGPPGSLRAQRVSIRHEVAGPVAGVAADGSFTVVGQRVALAPDAWGADLAKPGGWVAISGLRGADGTIQATRLDPRQQGPVLVRGTVQQADGALQIGAAKLQPTASVQVQPGQSATVLGSFDGRVLLPTELAPDLLAENPVAYFGSSTSRLLLEGVVTTRDGRVRLGRDWSVSAEGTALRDRSGRAVLEFERAADGSVRLRSSGGALSGPGREGERGGPGPRGGDGIGRGGAASRAFEPAPMPDRSFGEAGFGGRGAGAAGPGPAGRRAPGDGSPGYDSGRGGSGFGPAGGSVAPRPR